MFWVYVSLGVVVVMAIIAVTACLPRCLRAKGRGASSEEMETLEFSLQAYFLGKNRPIAMAPYYVVQWGVQILDKVQRSASGANRSLLVGLVLAAITEEDYPSIPKGGKDTDDLHRAIQEVLDSAGTSSLNKK